MMPDHMRALRTSAALALVAFLPPMLVGVALLGLGHIAPGGALLSSGVACAFIAVRAGVAFDRLRARQLGPDRR